MNKFHLVLGTVAASIATLVVMVTVSDPTPAPSDPFEGLHLSAPELEELADDEILNAPFVSYQSDSMEYKVTYPGTWTLDDTKDSFDGHILSDPLEHVIITITETPESQVLSQRGVEALADSIEQALKFDSAFTLERFDRLLWRGHPTIYTSGTRRIGGETFHTREYNIVRPDHTGMLNVNISTKDSAESVYEKPIREILKSLETCHDVQAHE